MINGLSRLTRLFSVTLILLGFNFIVLSQEAIIDTINIESITIFQERNALGTRPGLKSITIDSLIIKEKINLSLAELLQENSSIFIKTYGRGATATASFRGTGASHTNVYWNGIKINSPMSGEADFSLIPLYFIDDVAIHFGQSSMSFGSGGLGGSVNLQSTPDWTRQVGGKVYQSIGSYSTFSSAAKTTYGKNKVKAQTRVFRESSENNFKYRNRASLDRTIETQQNADYLKYGILQEIYYRPDATSMLSAKVWAQELDRNVPRLMSNFSSKEQNNQFHKSLNSVIDWHKSFYRFTWKASTGFSHIDLNHVYNKTSIEGNELPVIHAHSNSKSWYNKTGVSAKVYSWLNADIQAELNKHWVESREDLSRTGYDGTQLHTLIRTSLTASPLDRLSLSLLFAEEIYNKSISPLSYSLSGQFALLNNNNLFAKMGYSSNHHHPSLNDLHWQPGGNPNLKSEQGSTFEAGLKYNHHLNRNNFSFDISVFSSEISNWIMWLPHLKGYWEPVNLSLVKAKGVEISVISNIQLGEVYLRFIGSYSHTQSTIINANGVMRPESHGKQLPFIPVNSGGLVASSIWRSYHFIYSFTHFSERFTTTSNNPNSFFRLTPYYMSSAAIGKEFKSIKTPLALQLRIDNLLNENYQTILMRPMPGRNYSLVVSLAF
jgi:outer membrane cobalamin receptor